MKPSLRYDAIVLGAGVAGLTAAIRLAQDGARVCVLAKGYGSTHLAPGTVGVLGYAPHPVSDPAQALPGFIAQRPDHPYALIGVPAIGPALQWFADTVARGPQSGYTYVGGMQRNWFLPTAIGVLRPAALVPETMAGGDRDVRSPVCAVGISGLRDFHASLCAANLERAGVRARGIEVELDLGRPEVNALGLARRLDDPRARAAFAAALLPRLRGDERVALPAILGLLDPHGAWSDLQDRLGHPVFEVPTLPPSASGMRVYNALAAGLRAAGGRIVLGAEVLQAQREGDRVTALYAHTSGHDTVYGARWVVLATGGFHSGAIELDSDWQARETALSLSLTGLPDPGAPRFVPGYFEPQPMSRVGVAVQPSLQARGTENVFVAGAGLPGAEPWREGSGDGIALSTGMAAAQAIRQREGVRAEARAPAPVSATA